MAITYSVNADLLLDSGEDLESFLNKKLSGDNKETQLDNARDRAYRVINGTYLRDITLTPASLVSIPNLKDIEVDLVIANVLAGAHASGTKRKLPEKFYRDRAEESLSNLKFPATASTPVAGDSNTGNGTISVITTNDEKTFTENFTLIATDGAWFQVAGTRSKKFPNCEVNVNYPDLSRQSVYGDNDYNFRAAVPSKDYGDFPFYFKISSGSIAFAQYDIFTFKTYSSSKRKANPKNLILA